MQRPVIQSIEQKMSRSELGMKPAPKQVKRKITVDHPPRRRTERRREKTLLVLMEAALGLFYEKGIYWTKIEDITERADVGKGTFYQHFESKEDLLRALLQRGLDALLAKKTETIHGAKPGPRMLSAIVRAQLDFYLEHPEYLLLFHQVRGLLQLKSQTAKDLRAVYDEHLDQLGRLLRPMVNGKTQQNGMARKLGMAISAFTSGLLTYHLLFGKAGEIQRQRADLLLQLERSLQSLI